MKLNLGEAINVARKRKKEKEEEKEEEEEAPAVQEPSEKSQEEEEDKMQEINKHLLKEALKQLGPQEEEGYKKRLRDFLQDDFPIGLKHRRKEDGPQAGLTEEELHQRFTPEMMHYSMLSLVAQTSRSNEWASQEEVRKMGDGSSHHQHALPHGTNKAISEATKDGQRKKHSAVWEKSGTTMVCQESSEEVQMRPKRKSPHAWTGVTFFAREKKPEPKEGKVLVELPHMKSRWKTLKSGNG